MLVIVAPLVGRQRFRRFVSQPSPLHGAARTRYYREIVLRTWLLTALILLIARRHGLSLADFGQFPADMHRTLAITAGLLCALVLPLIIVMRRSLRAPSNEEPEGMTKLMPITTREQWSWVGLALNAGICEEILYRGFVLNLMAATLGSPWWGVIASGILFGTSHVYKGFPGMIATGLIGIGDGALVIWTHSLVPVQVLHAAIDILVGLLAGRAERSRLASTAVATAENAAATTPLLGSP